MRTVTVRVNHGESAASDEGVGETYSVEISPEDSIRALKERISSVISNSVMDPDLIQVTFGPSERIIGKRFLGDPLVDETNTFVKQYTFLQWLEQFPHWCLTVKRAADTPPPPGVAIKKAAASAEQEDPDQAVEVSSKMREREREAVTTDRARAHKLTNRLPFPSKISQDAYVTGELIRPEELPAPWGDKGLDIYKRDPLVRSIGDNPLPPSYGQASAPSNTQAKAPGAGWESSEVEIVPNVLDLDE